MRVTAAKAIARIGHVEIHGVQSVVELEALEASASKNPNNNTQAVPPSAINRVQSHTAIVVPCKDENLDHIKGVWAAIPASSLIILVSGSEPANYLVERIALIDFCNTTGRRGMCIHQRDPKVADALRAAGLQQLLDGAGDGLVYKGKGEGLVIGIALAAIARGPPGLDTTVTDETKETIGGDMQPGSNSLPSPSQGNINARRHPDGYYKYIGFVDADNFVPGSVQEYCRAFSAGVYLAQAEDAMVRINWSSKPKVQDGKLHFKPSGRSSEIVNHWLNGLLDQMKPSIAGNKDQDKTAAADLICTGNAGEHAMTMSLALKLRVASGYAIEPFHFLDIFERFAGDAEDGAGGRDKQVMRIQESSTKVATAFDTAQLPEMPVSPQASVLSSPMMSVCDESTMPTSPSLSSAALDKVPSIKRLPPALTTTGAYKTALAQTNAGEDLTPPDTPVSPTSPAKVQILQIRTINPHFHDNKGEDHVVRMWKQGLSAIYHSDVASAFKKYRDELRSAIFGGSEKEGVPTPPFSTSASVATSPTISADDSIKSAAVAAAVGWEPLKCRIYPAPGRMDLAQFRDKLEQQEGSFWWSGEANEVDGAAGESKAVSGLNVDLLGIGPGGLQKRPENDVVGFHACVDEGR